MSVPFRSTRRAAAVVASIALAGSLGVSAATAAPDPARTADETRAADRVPAPRQAERVPADLRVVGLTPNQRLLTFPAGDPSNANAHGMVTGLEGPDGALVGIDFRVQDGRLYGVGDGGGVYRISRPSAEAVLVNRLSVPLEGTTFGVDFNPAADRLRIISDTGQNLRHDVNDAAVPVTTVDVPLSYPPDDLGPVEGVTAAAYTNNDLADTTGTVLYDLDPQRSLLALQVPANNGTLSAVGSTGVNAWPGVGFDIYSFLNDEGTSTRVLGLASVKPMDAPRALYRVNLANGTLVRMQEFRRITPVVDLAIPLNQR